MASSGQAGSETGGVTMTTHADTGFSHSQGLTCTQCPVDEWPTWSNRAVSGLFEQVKALPADGATKSRDYGRGYSQAVRDVLDLFHETFGRTAESADEGAPRGR